MSPKPADTYLRKITVAYEEAPEGANTFREQIIKELIFSDSLVKYGSVTNVQKNSTGQGNKSEAAPGADTQSEIADLWASILALYDQIKSKIKAEFEASADFDYAEPVGFDYDAPCFDILTRNFTQLSAGSSVTLPDVRELRIPQIEEDSD